MIVQSDRIYYHVSGLTTFCRIGETAPGDGWRTEPYPGVIPDVAHVNPPVEAQEAAPDPIPDPFDHDGDGKPGGSLPRVKRKYTRRVK